MLGDVKQPQKPEHNAKGMRQEGQGIAGNISNFIIKII